MATREERAAIAEHDKIVALCHVMMSCEELTLNNAKLAPLLGIKDAKNVPRKLNNIIRPCGFEFQGNKIYKRADDGTLIAPVSTPKKPSGGGGNADELAAAGESSEASLPTIGRKKLPTKPRAKVTPSKKRKLEKLKDEAEEADDEASGVPAKEETPAPGLA